MMLALYAAFWLELEGASAAATCVGILSLQTRGQVFSKAAYRTAGTIIGLAASLAIAGLFNQTRDLFFLAACLWLGACTVVASLLDGTRAYCAILSGYTVAIVALPNVDSPLQTFSAAVNRGAAITVGIAAVALVNDMFEAPDLFPTVLGELKKARRKARAFAVRAMRDGLTAPAEMAALLKQITALHPDIVALSAESVAGRARRRAACLASASLVRVVLTTRVAAMALASLGGAADALRKSLNAALDQSGEPNDSCVLERAANAGLLTDRLIAEAASLVLVEHFYQTSVALDALRDGRWPAQVARLVPYKSRHAAWRNGLRTSVAWGLTTVLFSVLNWPGTITTLVQVGMLVGLSAINPDPRGFATAATIAIPGVAAAALATDFLVLNGVDQFPLLVLGMGPTIVVAALLLTTGKPRLAGIGFLALVYYPMILAPANPQNYDPQRLLLSGFLTVLATVALYLLLATLLRTDDAMKRDWMMRSAHADLRAALLGAGTRLDPVACAYRDADRIGQFSGLKDDGDNEADLASLIHMSGLASCVRRIRSTLTTDHEGRGIADQVQSVLVALDPIRLRDLGCELLHAEASRTLPQTAMSRVAVDLLLAATLIELDPRLTADLHEDRFP